MDINYQTISTKSPMGRSFIPDRTLYDIRLDQRAESAITNYLNSNSISANSNLEEHLKKIILNSLKLNRDLNWIPMQNLDVVRTPEEMITLMKLRSEVYAPLEGYKEEFPEEIKGLLYDDYDKSSVIFIFKRPDLISGSIRIVLDSENGLPSEKKINFDYLREKNYIAEFSRQVIHPKYQANGIEFKSFYAAAYNFGKINGVQTYIAGIDRNHLKLYQKFGGIKIEQELESYGNIKKSFLITSWDIDHSSDFFHKVILKERKYH